MNIPHFIYRFLCQLMDSGFSFLATLPNAPAINISARLPVGIPALDLLVLFLEMQWVKPNVVLCLTC